MYGALNADEDDGPIGEVLARGPAYVLRLALTYALLDGRREIAVDHLLAGLAVWQYAAASARRLFGDLSGYSDLDPLRDFLESAPQRSRTRTEIVNLFGRNRTAQDIDALLNELTDQGVIAVETEHTGKPGRPAVRVWWTGCAADAVAELLQRHETNEPTQKTPCGVAS